MKIILLEDESIALGKLKRLIQEIDRSIEIVGDAASVEGAIELINQHDDIDLGFFDIQLADGLSFNVFEQVKILFPVVFTTAYDEYAIEAFQHHSIGYLLKPLNKKDLHAVLYRYMEFWKPTDKIELLSVLNQFNKRQYKSRFTIKIGDRIKLIDLDEVACFCSRHKGTFILLKGGRSYDLDLALDALDDLLDPSLFFRVNRKHLIALKAIKSIVSYSNSRLKVELAIAFDEEIIVARDKVKAFKDWLEG